MTRLPLIAFLTLLLAGCGGNKPAPAPTGDHAGQAAGHLVEAGEHLAAANDADNPAEVAGHVAETEEHMGEAEEHANEAMHGEGDMMTIMGDTPTYTITTDDDYMVMITPVPQKPAAGQNKWEILVHAPGHVLPAAGEVEIEAEMVETGSGKNVEGLALTAGDPGNATLTFEVAGTGEYEVEIHVDRGEKGDSHGKFLFSIN